MSRVSPSIAAAVLSVSVLLSACISQTPRTIQSELDATPRGKVAVVDYVDFECPYCRKAHERLEAAMVGREDKVRLVLRHVPLRMHPLARPAARMAVCAERQRVPASKIAKAMFRATELGETGVRHAAEELGLDEKATEKCLADTTTSQRIEGDRDSFGTVDGTGVPLLYIGDRRFEGVQSADQLRQAIDRALQTH